MREGVGGGEGGSEGGEELEGIGFMHRWRGAGRVGMTDAAQFCCGRVV